MVSIAKYDFYSLDNLIQTERGTDIKVVLEDVFQSRLAGVFDSDCGNGWIGCIHHECFSFNLLWTSSSVPLKGPGVSILIETSAAANFKDSDTS